MSDPTTLPSNQELQLLSDDILGIAETIDNLPTAARADAAPKVQRLQVMEKALFRNIAEASESNQCAGSPSVNDLYVELRRETTSLKHEIDFLDQGNPTTVSAAGDVAMDAIESTVSAVADKVEEGIEAVRGKLVNNSK